jgi:Trm5-related predicted tRNA methylase
VETGDNVLIGGFIVTGTQPKKVIVRAIGPSLPVAGALADPVIELRDSSGSLIASNDNWRSDQETEILATTIAPTNDLESAIVATLPANNASYTAIVRGVNNGTGVGLVEVYDLNQLVDSKLANISTRGLVQTEENVLIAGTIVLGPGSRKVLVRAIGPSLAVAGRLADPALELRDGDGTLLRSNDNWRIDQEAEIMATTIPPTDDLEAAIVQTLPGNGAAYTAIVRGVNDTTGVALVEVYALP